jgi:protein sidekick
MELVSVVCDPSTGVGTCAYLFQDWFIIADFIFVTDMGTFEDATEREVSVESGRAAVLDLPAIESHPAPLVTWSTDGDTQLYDRKYAVTADNQLVILDASETDQKAYR